jgi:hypothetical protein
MDFALTGRKRSLRCFKNVPCLKQFDAWFEREREWRTLWHLGFTPQQIDRLRQRGRSEIGDLRRALAYFEDLKVARGMEKLPDGVTHRPVFMIRNLLRELPAFYLDDCDAQPGRLMEPQAFCRTMAASYASRRDMRLTPTRIAHAKNFQHCYQRLVEAAGAYDEVLASMHERAAVINYENRITGNGVLGAVEKMVAMMNEARRSDFQSAIDRFIQSQVLIPGECKPLESEEIAGSTRRSQLLSAMQTEIEDAREAV